MLVVKQDAEKKALETLKKQWEKFPTYRCLQLKLSKLETDKNEWLSLVTHMLNSFIDDQSAQAYVCQDGDIFILTRYMTTKRLDSFLTHLSPVLAPISDTQIDQRLASLFEIGVDWPTLRNICEKKIENNAIESQKKNRKEKKQAVEQVSREDALKTLNRDLISSLAMRREMRERPEIMVVEDDPMSQRLVSNTLRDSYSLSMTDDGQGAIMGYVHKAPDVLFLDIGLPDIDGHQVLEKLFELDPDAYIVMFSGNGDKENVLKAVELGAKGFIGKPFSPEKLFQYIQKSPFIQAKQKKELRHGNSVH